MRGAYRQCPNLDSQLLLILTALLNPDTGEVELFELFGQPFGAVHAVLNFNRLAEWLCRVIRRLYHLVLEHYFDDFMCVEAEFPLAVGMFCFRRTVELFGFQLEVSLFPN